MYALFYVILVVSSWCFTDGSDADGDDLLLRLQRRVTQLERQRTVDGDRLELLREKCERAPNDVVVDLTKLESSLDALRTDVASLTANKERETARLSDLRELRLDLDSVHSDYGKLKVELEGLKDRREEDLKVVGQQRNSQVTIKWLQKTSEDLRREITELAAAHNVSAAIRQQQKSDNAFNLLRSDVQDLRTKLESVRVTQDRNAATLSIIQQDVTDLQNQRHQSAANYQLFREEVSQLKDEFLLTLNSLPTSTRSLEASARGAGSPAPDQTTGAAQKKKKLKFRDDEEVVVDNDVIAESLINGETHHRIRHRGGRALKEVEELRVVVAGLQTRQKHSEHKMNELKRNHTAVESNLHHVWGRMADLLNASRWRAAQHASVERAIGGLREELKRVEEGGVETAKTLHNLTDSVSGIDKLHSSTIQLFEALEGLEDDYSARIADLHKEVSKFEFNMAQLSSTVNILKEDQSNQFAAIKSTRADMSGIRQQVEDQNYRLTSLRSQVLHDEANSLLRRHRNGGNNNNDNNVPSQPTAFRMGRDEDQTGLILDLESRVAEFDARLQSQARIVNETADAMRYKADLDHIIHWAKSADRLDDKITNMSREVEGATSRITHLEHQIKDILQQFPTDCSAVQGSKSGLYQIHPSGAANSITVLCDMDGEEGEIEGGGGWTVVQNRYGSNDVDFDRSWVDYREGFGSVSSQSDFWLGNDALHRLSGKGATLRLELWDEEDVYRYAVYDSFRVEDEAHSYRLHVSGFEGNVSDALSYHQGMKFSTRDVDRDLSDTVNCAEQYEGGWWYRNCQHTNLNGKYSLGLTWFDQDSNTWLPLKRVQMKIRPKKTLKNDN